MYEFDDNSLAQLKSYGLLPDAYRSVFAGGSLVRGWGNHTSDVDVFVIVDEPPAIEDVIAAPVRLDPEQVHVKSVYLDGRRWDVEYWRHGQVEQLMAKVAHEEFAAGKEIGLWLSRHETDFLDKFSTSKMLDGAAWFDTWHNVLHGSAYRLVVASHALNFYDNYAEDVVGQLDVGDNYSAVLSAHNALGYAVDALLATYGEFGSGSKWRARRFLAANPTEASFEQYWALETMRSYRPDDPGAWAREVLVYCRDLCAALELT